MLNINQNFDLKAPVFNFDRDYFNSVEELNAYDASNVPNHFVTNVAGMLYQFTDGSWVPMIQASYGDLEDPEDHSCSLNLIDDNCFVSKNPDDNAYYLHLGTDDTYVDINNSSSIEMRSTFSDYPKISISQEIDEVYKRMWIGNSWDKGFGLNIVHEKYLDSLLQYSKYIKIFVDKELTQEEQDDGYSQVDMSLTDGDYSADINAKHGFTYTNQNLRTSVNSNGLTVETLDLTTEASRIMSISHNGISTTEPAGSARLDINTNNINITGAYENTLTIEAPYSTDNYSEISLRREPDIETTINAEDGFIQTGPVCTGFYGCHTQFVQLNRANIHFYKKDQSKQQTNAKLGFNKLENFLLLGNDQKFKISRPIDDTEGATITGVKSITAFSDPSNTKVFATDGSIVDLSTKANASDLDAKANTSDVLLKKSTSGGYYIEENGNVLGRKAFATNSDCTASGNYAHAEGVGAAIGYSSHAEGISTASGNYTHSEGSHTIARGINSHSEGDYTIAGGFCSHVQGIYNIDSVNAIHSVGIGDATTRKNAEYIYAKNNTNGTAIVDDPKNGYKYLIGVGGYDGISTDNTTYKSVQEVIADLTARIEQLETKVKALEDANTPA